MGYYFKVSGHVGNTLLRDVNVVLIEDPFERQQTVFMVNHLTLTLKQYAALGFSSAG